MLSTKDFQLLPLVDLALITKISASKWSLYFNNKSTISERNLVKAAIALHLSPEQVLKYINERRQFKMSQKCDKPVSDVKIQLDEKVNL